MHLNRFDHLLKLESLLTDIPEAASNNTKLLFYALQGISASSAH